MRKSFICSLLSHFLWAISHISQFLLPNIQCRPGFPRMQQRTSPWHVLPVLPNTTAYLPWRSTLFLNSVSQSTHRITKLVPQARMLWVLTFLSIKNTSKSPWALILCGSELSFKGPITYLFNLVYLWLHRLLSKQLSFLFCLYPFYQPPISSNLPSIFLKYISDHAACLL